LFITYIVTSKPNLISVAAGLVHMLISFKSLCKVFTLHDYYIIMNENSLAYFHERQVIYISLDKIYNMC